MRESLEGARANTNTNTNTKYTCDTGQTRNKLLAQWVHLTNHAAGHSRPGTAHLTACAGGGDTGEPLDAVRVEAAEEKGGGDGCGEDYDGWEGDVDADAELTACLDEETLFGDSD